MQHTMLENCAARDAALDDLLSRWHAWQQARGNVTRGFNGRALVTGEYRSSRQYDGDNGVLDDDIDDARSRVVEAQVQELVHPWRTAIYVVARNLSTGQAVWNSPRLPQAARERDVIVTEARRLLSRRLELAGLL